MGAEFICLGIGCTLLAVPLFIVLRIWMRFRGTTCIYCAYQIRDQYGQCPTCHRQEAPRQYGFEVLQNPPSTSRDDAPPK